MTSSYMKLEQLLDIHRWQERKIGSEFISLANPNMARLSLSKKLREGKPQIFFIEDILYAETQNDVWK